MRDDTIDNDDVTPQTNIRYKWKSLWLSPGLSGMNSLLKERWDPPLYFGGSSASHPGCPLGGLPDDGPFGDGGYRLSRGPSHEDPHMVVHLLDGSPDNGNGDSDCSIMIEIQLEHISSTHSFSMHRFSLNADPCVTLA